MEESERARLVERHVDIPQRAAKMMYSRVKDHVEFAELVSLGNQGLVEAATRYDPSKGASFSTFAWYRVQGAIVDGLRRMTQLPRRVWARLVALRAAAEYLEHAGERDIGLRARTVAIPEGPDALAKVKSSIAAIRTMYMTSLEGLTERTGFDVAADTANPAERIDTSRLAVRLKAALSTLPDRERALMTKHYWEGKNLLEAGEELGISKSWACRLHAQAVERLRKAVDDS